MHCQDFVYFNKYFVCYRYYISGSVCNRVRITGKLYNILPVEKQTDTLYVDVTVYLQSISELNEISGQVIMTMGFTMNWNDSQLTWNPTKYGDMLKNTESVRNMDA